MRLMLMNADNLKCFILHVPQTMQGNSLRDLQIELALSLDQFDKYNFKTPAFTKPEIF